jgi:hypothetical protein
MIEQIVQLLDRIGNVREVPQGSILALLLVEQKYYFWYKLEEGPN